ncbi:MAG: hypothetical protein DMF00_03630 [Verrucomicrobia bacterium]|nr:MAG: hypothetical protein DMF00_03630 [Verrucomicrobiota bacterium]
MIFNDPTPEIARRILGKRWIIFQKRSRIRQHGFAAEAFKYCDSVVPEAHAWEVIRSMLAERCIFANQMSLLSQRVIFTYETI